MSGQLPPQKPAITTKPQPIPVEPQPIPVKPIPESSETKRSFFLLALILGISFAVLFVVAGIIGLILLLGNAGDGGSDSKDVADAGERDVSPFGSPSRTERRSTGIPNRFSNRSQLKEIEDFDTALVSLNSSFPTDQERALEWMAKNTIPKSELKRVVDRSAKLLTEPGSRSVQGKSFDLLLKHGNASHTSTVIKAGKIYRLSEKQFGRWFKKYNDTKYADSLIDMLGMAGSPADLGKSALLEMGKKIEPQILQNYNSKHYNTRRSCRDMLSKWKTDRKKIAKQCILDLTNTNKSTSDVLQWLKTSEPISDLKPLATQQIIKLMSDKKRRTFHRYDATKIIVKWGDESACGFIADSELTLFTDPKAIADFLMQFNSKDAARGLARLIGNYRVDRNKVVAALVKFGSEAEDFVLPYVNESDSRKRDDARSLLVRFKTESKKIAAQCIADFTTDEPSLRHRKTTAIEYLAKLKPQPNSGIAKALGEFLSHELPKERRDFLTDRVAFAFCNWADQDQKQMLQSMVDDRSYRICVAAIMRQLQIDSDQGKRNLKKHFADFSRRRELAKMLTEKGPEVEEIVHSLLSTSDEGEVVDALNILKQIGTSKSVSQIEKVAGVAKKFNKRRALRTAEEALAAIKQRDESDQ